MRLQLQCGSSKEQLEKEEESDEEARNRAECNCPGGKCNSSQQIAVEVDALYYMASYNQLFFERRWPGNESIVRAGLTSGMQQDAAGAALHKAELTD
ncbi:hypothetical protein TWF481_002454 [Arthrobotrys musiformis]|uniref:Uncharacterized protein n=1 Tax=Arthrobotrys musiformis TaxID=47236 RepID=A0AAV9VV44_9PEZI